MVEKTWEKY